MDTSTFTTDNVGAPEPITVNANCRQVSIREQGIAGTTDFNIRSPYATSPAVRYIAGEAFISRRTDAHGSFIAGQIIGYIEAIAAGTFTFSMVCE